MKGRLILFLSSSVGAVGLIGFWYASLTGGMTLDYAWIHDVVWPAGADRLSALSGLQFRRPLEITIALLVGGAFVAAKPLLSLYRSPRNKCRTCGTTDCDARSCHYRRSQRTGPSFHEASPWNWDRLN